MKQVLIILRTLCLFALAMGIGAGVMVYVTIGIQPSVPHPEPNTGIAHSALLSNPSLRDVLTPYGATWKYLDTGSDANTAWRASNFSDATWPTGPAPLGYGDVLSTTIGYGADTNNKYITSYFRQSFSVTNPSAYEALTLRLLRDDGAVVYLNGSEIFRSNLPAGFITYTTRASVSQSGLTETLSYPSAVVASLLITGTNVIAVEVHQAAPTSSDVRFNLELVGEKPIAPLPHAPPGTTRFAIVGDFGYQVQPAQDVARRIRSWNPEFVTTLGDNNYETGSTTTIDLNIGFFYQNYIYPYAGAYGPGATVNRFFPVLGNHDWASESGADPYLNYFTLPGNERYYDFVRGSVHFFVLDSDPHEPDGVNVASAQAQWLQARLAASTATWKLVLMHHPPYSSSTHGSTAWMQWPFKAWGATTVLAGHDHSYERLAVDGLPYVVNGSGGRPLYAFKTP